MWVIHSWPWYWLVWPWCGGRMYRIVIGVTSDVGVPSTYLVKMMSLHITTSYGRVVFEGYIKLVIHVHQIYSLLFYFLLCSLGTLFLLINLKESKLVRWPFHDNIPSVLHDWDLANYYVYPIVPRSDFQNWNKNETYHNIAFFRCEY